MFFIYNVSSTRHLCICLYIISCKYPRFLRVSLIYKKYIYLYLNLIFEPNDFPLCPRLENIYILPRVFTAFRYIIKHNLILSSFKFINFEIMYNRLHWNQLYCYCISCLNNILNPNTLKLIKKPLDSFIDIHYYYTIVQY